MPPEDWLHSPMANQRSSVLNRSVHERFELRVSRRQRRLTSKLCRMPVAKEEGSVAPDSTLLVISA